MLSNDVEDVNLEAVKEKLAEFIPEEVKPFIMWILS